MKHNQLFRMISLFALALLMAASQTSVFAAPARQDGGPTATIHLDPGSVRTTAPTSIHTGDTVTYAIDIQNLPPEGLTSAEFACRYDDELVTIPGDRFVDTHRFGDDAIVAINGPTGGTFVYAIAGTTQRATNAGTVFTFDMVAGGNPGTFTFDCTVRASKGGALFSVPFSSISITINPVPTQGTVTGIVNATKAITVTLLSGMTEIDSATPASGAMFSFAADPGTYTVKASAPGFLSAIGSAVVVAGGTVTKNTITLKAGDINNDGIIDDLDVVTIGIHYNQTTPAEADLNSDGIINILDLQALAPNYLATTPVWLP